MKSSNVNQNAPIILFWSVPSISQIRDYKRNCEMLKEANKQFKSVEVISKSNRTEKFKSIEMESDNFYGLKKIQGDIKRILLNVNTIKSIILL